MFRSTSSGEAPRISGLFAVFCPWSAESFLSRKTIRRRFSYQEGKSI